MSHEKWKEQGLEDPSYKLEGLKRLGLLICWLLVLIICYVCCFVI